MNAIVGKSKVLDTQIYLCKHAFLEKRKHKEFSEHENINSATFQLKKLLHLFIKEFKQKLQTEILQLCDSVTGPNLKMILKL